MVKEIHAGTGADGGPNPAIIAAGRENECQQNGHILDSDTPPLGRRTAYRVGQSVAEREVRAQQKTGILAYVGNMSNEEHRMALTQLQFEILNAMMDDYEDVEQVYLAINREFSGIEN